MDFASIRDSVPISFNSQIIYLANEQVGVNKMAICKLLRQFKPTKSLLSGANWVEYVQLIHVILTYIESANIALSKCHKSVYLDFWFHIVKIFLHMNEYDVLNVEKYLIFFLLPMKKSHV